MWFVFRRSRKTNHLSSLLRERSERKTSVFNQKTMFLGYAHSSNIYWLFFASLKNRPKCFSFGRACFERKIFDFPFKTRSPR
ncbi:MAG: hypothetical protein U5L45_20290 [Saprospiraceae bacterium]|nr:hypothetical protein [Saprospiraceae bacterium]